MLVTLSGSFESLFIDTTSYSHYSRVTNYTRIELSVGVQSTMVSTSFFSRLRATLWISTSWALMRQGALSLSTNPSTRARFLSSSATTFLATATILGSNPEESTAAMMGSKKKVKNVGNNPRYVDRELEMKYGEDKGKQAATLCERMSCRVCVLCVFIRSNLTTNLSNNRTFPFIYILRT